MALEHNGRTSKRASDKANGFVPQRKKGREAGSFQLAECLNLDREREREREQKEFVNKTPPVPD